MATTLVTIHGLLLFLHVWTYYARAQGSPSECPSTSGAPDLCLATFSETLQISFHDWQRLADDQEDICSNPGALTSAVDRVRSCISDNYPIESCGDKSSAWQADIDALSSLCTQECQELSTRVNHVVGCLTPLEELVIRNESGICSSNLIPTTLQCMEHAAGSCPLLLQDIRSLTGDAASQTLQRFTGQEFMCLDQMYEGTCDEAIPDNVIQSPSLRRGGGGGRAFVSACDANPCISRVISYLGIELTGNDTLLSTQQSSVCSIFRLDTEMSRLHLATAQTCTGVILAEDACTIARRATMDGLRAIEYMCTSGCEYITSKAIGVEECIENQIDVMSAIQGTSSTLSDRLGMAACVEMAVGDCSVLRLPIARILQHSPNGSPTLALFSNHTWQELDQLGPRYLGITLALATEPTFSNGCYVDESEAHARCLTDVYRYIDIEPKQHITRIGYYCGRLIGGVDYFREATNCLDDIYSAEACSDRLLTMKRRLQAYVLICRHEACSPDNMVEKVSAIWECLRPAQDLLLPVDQNELFRVIDDILPCVHEAVGGCPVLRTYINSLLAGQPRRDIHFHTDQAWSILLKALGEILAPHQRSLEGYMATPEPGCGVDTRDARACLTDFENRVGIYSADVQKHMCKLLKNSSSDLDWALGCLQTREVDGRCHSTMDIYVRLCQRQQECDHVIAKVIEVNHCLSGLSAVASGEGSIPCSEVSNRTRCVFGATGGCQVLRDVIQMTIQGDGGDIYRVFTSDPWNITLPLLKGDSCEVSTGGSTERHLGGYGPNEGAHHFLQTYTLYITIGAIFLAS